MWRVRESSLLPWDHLQRSGSGGRLLSHLFENVFYSSVLLTVLLLVLRFRMSLRTSLSAASSWSSPCPCGLCRRCCPTPLWMRYSPNTEKRCCRVLFIHQLKLTLCFLSDLMSHDPPLSHLATTGCRFGQMGMFAHSSFQCPLLVFVQPESFCHNSIAVTCHSLFREAT